MCSDVLYRHPKSHNETSNALIRLFQQMSIYILEYTYYTQNMADIITNTKNNFGIFPE